MGSLRGDAWNELFRANARLDWQLSRPSQRQGGQWEQYAFDPRPTAHAAPRTREWTAVGPTEVECIREMARCLREIADGRIPT